MRHGILMLENHILSIVQKSLNNESKPKFKKEQLTRGLEKCPQVVKPSRRDLSLMLDYLHASGLSANEDQAFDSSSLRHVSYDV